MRKQMSLIDQLPRALKQGLGRTMVAQVPAHIRVVGVDLSQEERAIIRQRLGGKLAKYATSIERVSVRVADVNGTRGGVDKVCRVKVVLSGLPSVIFESQAAALDDALNGAIAGTERTVRRSIRARRAKSSRAVILGEFHPAD